jgi:hypothetical protein
LLLRGAGLLLLQFHHPRHQFDRLVMPRLDIVIKQVTVRDFRADVAAILVVRPLTP